MPEVVIQVTSDDIAAGKRGACRSCPVALAMIRATGRTCEVQPDAIKIYERSLGGRYVLVALPDRVKVWICNFDRFGGANHNATPPFAFAIVVPEKPPELLQEPASPPPAGDYTPETPA